MSFKEMYKSKNIPYNCLVLQGGGLKGVSYSGMYKALENNDILKNIKHFCGSSIGSLFALMGCLNMKSKEIKQWIIDYKESDVLYDSNFLMRIVYLIPSFQRWGLDYGTNLENTIKKLISFKLGEGNEEITFSQLYNLTGNTLCVCATNLNRKKPRYFSNYFSPDFKVYLAVRMSMSYPTVYTPVIFDNDMYVDGGVMDNFPMELMIDTYGKNSVLGAIFLTPDEKITKEGKEIFQRKDINTLIDYTKSIIDCIQISKDNSQQDNFSIENIIYLKVPNTSMYNLNLTIDEKEDFYNQGIKDTECFLKKVNLLNNIQILK